MRNYSGAWALAKTERNTQAGNRESFSNPLNSEISLGWTSWKGYPFPAVPSAIFYQLKTKTKKTNKAATTTNQEVNVGKHCDKKKLYRKW